MTKFAFCRLSLALLQVWGYNNSAMENTAHIKKNSIAQSTSDNIIVKGAREHPEKQLPQRGTTSSTLRSTVDGASNQIIVKGAREHNLKNIDVTIPRDKFVVITGLSGSGKSSLAFDTIYAEGQRRYVESLSSYARQFLGQMDKPDVDYIEGLSPAISIDQKSVSKNPRSTVGTVTEIYDYLRVLFARVGVPYCPKCGSKIEAQTIDQMADMITDLFAGQTVTFFAPVVRGRKGEYLELIREYIQKGFVKAKIDCKVVELSDAPKLGRYKQHDIDIFIDSIKLSKDGLSEDARLRLNEAIETASALSEGTVICESEKNQISLSTRLACSNCDYGAFPELEPRLFSFNSPFGACQKCAGLGFFQEFDAELVLPDKNKTIAGGGILPWSYAQHNWWGTIIGKVCEQYRINQHQPIKDLPQKHIDLLMYGKGIREKIRMQHRTKSGSYFEWNMKFRGIMKLLEKRYRETSSDAIREDLAKYMTRQPCAVCGGKRLKPEVLNVRIYGKNIADLAAYSIRDLKKWFDELELNDNEQRVASRIVGEISTRLSFLVNVGLNYLTLDRTSSTLSGGETQRIRLASQIGSGLVGVLYVLDEPSIGLHQRDNKKLLDSLMSLRDLGNSILVIEHDQETMESADYIIDLGPGAGKLGGDLVAAGSVEEIKKNKNSLTGQYLAGDKWIDYSPQRRGQSGEFITIRGAVEHNLKNISVRIPVGSQFICVTGVSGSGKSTLVNDIIYKTLANKLNHAWMKPGKHKEIEGVENLDKVVIIDQSPIGRTPRSNPATYTKTFDFIRQLFAKTPEARVRGYEAGRFSFNVAARNGGGRCEKCRGDGALKVEMHFLPDVYLPCDVCGGKRYNRETLQVRYKGKNIAEVLDMTVAEALEFFKSIPVLRAKLQTLFDVGLGYIHLGQSATTLSGGEAQRVKLSTELSKRATGKTIYILDEPTTGLHFDDVKKLLEVLHRLVDEGNTVLVIEHNLDVIKTADYIIDLGPEGGERGGKVVAAGTPEMIAGIKESYTGQYLNKVLNKKYVR